MDSIRTIAMSFSKQWTVGFLCLASLHASAPTASGTVLDRLKISATSGGLTGPLEDEDRFGSAMVALGDLDGDGLSEIAVGSPLDDTGGPDRGAVWILFPNADGTVRHEVKIASGADLGSDLHNGDAFGSSLAADGDLDGDGVPDLLVGAPYHDGVGRDRGAIWILNLTAAGTVARRTRVDLAGLGRTGQDFDAFGQSVAILGQLDGLGGPEIAVGAPGDDGSGPDHGAVWILGWTDAGLEWNRKISGQESGFVGPLDDGDAFGSAIATIETTFAVGARIAVGARFDDDGGVDRGAVWVLRLDHTGSVVRDTKISQTAGGFGGALRDQALFGSALASLGGGDLTNRLAVGASGDTGISSLEPGGTVWILSVDAEDRVDSFSRIRTGEGGFERTLRPGDGFGASLSTIDLDGGGWPDLMVGAPGDDDGGDDHGAAWFVPLDGTGTAGEVQKVSDLEGGLAGGLVRDDRFGSALASLGDLDGDGIDEMAIGTPGDDGEGVDRGALWVLKLRRDGTVADQAKIRPGLLGTTYALADGDRFGSALADLGDGRLAVGTPGDDAGAPGTGAVWIVRVSAAGELLEGSKISALDPALAALPGDTAFGSAVAPLGDLDGDGVGDLAVGAPRDLDGGSWKGAVWILFLRPDASVKGATKISAVAGGFTGTLADFDVFGSSLASVGDLDGDGQPELAVGAPLDDDGITGAGAVWLLTLRDDGTVARHTKISSTSGGFGGSLLQDHQFGTSLAAVRDVDRDGLAELVAGAVGDDELGSDRGSAWLLHLRPDGTVRLQEKILDGEGVLPAPRSTSYSFGAAGVGLSDVNGDGVGDLAVGATGADDGAINAGAVWILFLDGERSPRLLAAEATSRTTVRLEFSERMLPSSAEFEDSYVVAPADDPPAAVVVSAAGLQPNGRTVELVLDEPLQERVYRIEVSDLLDEAGIPLAADARSLELTVPPLSFQVELPGREYRGFGVALLPFDPQPSWVLRTLGDDDGDRNWRVSRWSPADRAYVHAGTSSFSDMIPGQGYWIITRGREVLRVGGFELPAEPFEIPLAGGPGDPESPAWNQVANPFPFPVRAGDLRVRDDAGGVRLMDAENVWTSPAIRDGWTGSYRPLGVDECLQPGVAYWIEKIVPEPVWLIIPDTAADACAPPATEVALPRGAEWMIVLRAAQDGVPAEPLILGARSDDGPSIDPSSGIVPPRPDGRAPRLYVVEDRVGSSRRYARSFRPAKDRMRWTVHLEAAHAPAQIEMSASTVGLAGAVLWRDGHSSVPLRIDSPRTWSVAATSSALTFELEVDRSGSVPIESPVPDVAFDLPYPNPFTSTTGFRFRLGGPQRLWVTIYDLAGRRVRELSQDADGGGERVVVWDGADAKGRPVAAGVYLARQRIDGGPAATYRILKLR